MIYIPSDKERVIYYKSSSYYKIRPSENQEGSRKYNEGKGYKYKLDDGSEVDTRNQKPEGRR